MLLAGHATRPPVRQGPHPRTARRRLCLGFVALLATLAPGWAATGTWEQLPSSVVDGGEAEAAWARPREVVLRLRPGAARRQGLGGAPWPGELRLLLPRPAGGARLRAAAGPSVFEELALLRLPAGADLAETLEALRHRDDVLYAEPNLRLRIVAGEPPAVAEPDDFEFTRQWSLHNRGQTGGTPGADIGALGAWALTTGAAGIAVAIIDTGVDYFHPDLEPNIWRNPGEVPGNGVDDDANGYVDDVHGFDFVSEDGDPMDDNVHGTHVAGVLGAAGNDGNGIAGVAWRAGLMALKAFDDAGSGSLDDTLAAVGYAVANGARVINASWGTTTRSRALDEAVEEAVARGVVFVAAAGNNGTDTRFYPASVPTVIAVGATDARDASPTFSNYGSFVDLVAPGEAIHSTLPNATWGILSGTSMAAPHVSGLVVLVLARRPEFTPAQVARILESTARELSTDRFTGAGRIDAARAVRVEAPLPEAGLEVAGVLSGVVPIRGRADGNGFAGYQLELGSGSRPAEWRRLHASDTPVSNGVLMPAFDTTVVDDGVYVLRLSVTNNGGEAAVERAEVQIRNVQLLSPLNNDILRSGDVVPVLGTVAGEGRQYELEWALGRNPAAWQRDGVILRAGGVGPLIQGALATWDSSVGPREGFVTLRLTARVDGRPVGDAFARMVFIEDQLRAGWPRHLPFEDEFPLANWREPNAADLEGDGVLEVFFVDHGEPGGRPPRLRVLDPAGREVWQRDLPAGAPEFDAPVAGDLDGDGRLEVVVDTGDGGAISVFNATGEPMGGGWPATPGGTHFGKLVADLDGDGRSEVVALSSPPPDLVGANARRLVVLRGDGQVWRQWVLPGCDEESRSPEQLPVVVNLDDDPWLELVAPSGCTSLAAFDLEEPSGPVWTTDTRGLITGSPVAGDLEGDGTEEVIVGTVEFGTGVAGVHLLQASGEPRHGWPVLTEDSFHASAALADLDLDGRLEIIIPSWDSARIHALRADGFELLGWPVAVNGSTRSVPVVGDVDGDGWPDVVLPSPGAWLPVVLNGDTARAGGVRAWNLEGRPIDFLPGAPGEGLVMETAGGGRWMRMPAPILADLDGDGELDVVAASVQDSLQALTPPLSSFKMRSSLYAWRLPEVPAGSLPWPAFHGGPGRTGRYPRVPPPNVPPVLESIPNQTVAVGQTFRPIPLDRYVHDPDGKVDELAWSVAGATELNARIDADRVALIVPPASNWSGREILEFAVRDARGGRASVRVTFEARPGYVPPQAVADALQTEEETPVVADLLTNDSSPRGLPLRILGVSRPGAGTVARVGERSVRYTPDPDFFGEDLFEYTLGDTDGGFATVEVRVQVVGVPDDPRPVEDRLILDEDGSGEVNPLENDIEVDGEAMTLESVGTPANGTLTTPGGGRWLYTPRPDFHGLDAFSYLVRDAAGHSATGLVSVLVRPINDPPVLQPQTIALNRNRTADVFYAATDADGDTLSFNVVDGPTNGVLLSYPTLANYEPRKGFVGVDRFTYTASDGQFQAGPQTVTFLVEDRNNTPRVADVATVTAVDQPLTIGLPVSDVDGDPFTIRLAAVAANGSVELDGTNALYQPRAGYVGFDEFTYVAGDAGGESPAATVRVEVTDRNTPPRALQEVLTVVRNQSNPIVLRADDAENNPLRYEVLEEPGFGILEGAAPLLTYTPRPNFRGLDRLSFRALDRFSTSEVAVVHLLVRDPNTAPVSTNQTVLIRKGEPGLIELSVRDADGHALRAAILRGTRHGRLYGTGTRYWYEPAPAFEGADSFTYKAWDGFTYSATATVSIQVQSPPPAPLEMAGLGVGASGLEVVVRGEAGRPVVLEFSDDLRSWETLVQLPNPTGTVRWSDGGWAARVSGYYRARRADD